jgi:hypothetical protein
MNKVSLPGLSLAAAVVVAAVLALLGWESTGAEPGRTLPPPEGSAVLRLQASSGSSASSDRTRTAYSPRSRRGRLEVKGATATSRGSRARRSAGPRRATGGSANRRAGGNRPNARNPRRPTTPGRSNGGRGNRPRREDSTGGTRPAPPPAAPVPVAPVPVVAAGPAPPTTGSLVPQTGRGGGSDDDDDEDDDDDDDGDHDGWSRDDDDDDDDGDHDGDD